MDTAACNEEPSIESEFVRTYKFIDLYLQQKTDLFLQHYVFEPFDFLIKRIIVPFYHCYVTGSVVTFFSGWA